MSEFIKSIEISGFRGFKNLRVPIFGKVNLITGKNNAGKSSLLEAIRILVTRGTPDTLRAILNYREENNDMKDAELLEDGFGPYRNLFTGFPEFDVNAPCFSIQASGAISPAFSSLSITANKAVRQVNPERGTASYKLMDDLDDLDDLFGDTPAVPVLEFVLGDLRRILPLQSLSFRRPISASFFAENTQDAVRCVYLDPFSSRSTSQLGTLWDAIALTDAQSDVLKALQLISPEIEAVSMIGGSDSRMRSRTAIVKSRQFDSPIPLRTFGDGVNRLFGIVLSLCNAKNGVLLVDEFENGLHFSVQENIWKIIFRMAAELNVQVFATSHSRDCVQAFQEAASDSPQDGVLIRLTRKGEAVIPTVFQENELEIATRNDIEVR